METSPKAASAKVALVTGASRGIGAATARALAADGYRVAIHYRSGRQEAEALAQELPGAYPIQADLADPAAAEQLIKIVRSELGSLDVLVNNAGVAVDQILLFAKPEDFDKLIATNLKPVFLLSKYAAKAMAKQKAGRIINVSSVVGFTGNPGQSIYAATKAAITSFSRSIALELAPFGILVNDVAPGLIATDMTAKIPEEALAQIKARIPLGRPGTPDEVGSVIRWLASPSSSYVTGTTIHVNGGMY